MTMYSNWLMMMVTHRFTAVVLSINLCVGQLLSNIAAVESWVRIVLTIPANPQDKE